MGRPQSVVGTCRVTAARFFRAADAHIWCVMSRDTHLLVEGDLLQEAQGLLCQVGLHQSQGAHQG